MKDNYFIIHGSFSSPFSNWIPYLRNEIEKKNLEVYTPDLPSGVGYQTYDNWQKILKVFVDSKILTEKTTIFAHSIAPVFICKFLIENKIKVKKLVFVCGFNNYLGLDEDYDAVNKSMYLGNLDEIKKYCDNIVCYYSDNDPYVKYEVEKDFADTIATKQNIVPNGGHLNTESGYQEFQDLLTEI